MDNLTSLSDEELLSLILDSNRLGPDAEKLRNEAIIEKSRRNKARDEMDKQKMVKAFELGIERIATGLEFIAKKPKESIAIGIIIAIMIGVATSILTDLVKQIPNLISGKINCKILP